MKLLISKQILFVFSLENVQRTGIENIHTVIRVKGWTILVAVDQSAEYCRTQQDLEHAKVILPHENVC